MQGLQWSVLLSVAMSWNAFATVQLIEPNPEDLAFIDPVRTEDRAHRPRQVLVRPTAYAAWTVAATSTRTPASDHG